METYNVKVSVVIVSMNHLGNLKNLLNSLDGNGKISFSHEIIIVDNCSADDTVSYIAKNYPHIILHVNKKKHGFAYNNNLGVSLASGEYIFICNPDIIFLETAVDNLLIYSIRHGYSGILCPKLLNSDYTYQASVRNFHNVKILLYRLLSKGNDRTKSKIVQKYLLYDFDKNKIQHVDWAIGAAMLVKKETYTKLKGFDERFFLYVEDEDLCLRTWNLGYPVTYYPESVMIHDHQRKSSNGINKMSWYHFSSLLYFFLKHRFTFKRTQTSTDYNTLINDLSIVPQPAQGVNDVPSIKDVRMNKRLNSKS